MKRETGNVKRESGEDAAVRMTQGARLTLDDSRFTFHVSRASPLVYEINTRCWLRELSDASGRRITLADVPESAFARWQELGFTHLWLMGVWTTGPRSRAVALDSFRNFKSADLAGSPYAIAEYRVAEALGGDAGLQQFRRELHRRGMKLLLDFVPNHVGLDHPWLRTRPELFVQSPNAAPGAFAQETSRGARWLAQGRDPNFPPWTDTAQLDYRRPATRAAMQAELLAIADRCDGVRCDMAMLVLGDVFAKTWAAFPALEVGVPPAGGPERAPPEGGTPNRASDFWPEAIAAAKRAHPDFVFLAEVYWGLEARLQALGFDFTYDKELYDELVRRNPKAVHDRLLKAEPRFLEASAHFLENHDEPRIASLLSFAEHRAAAWLVLGLPGLRLLHEGQLCGARLRTPVQSLRRLPEETQPAIQQFYEPLLVSLRDTAVGRGRAALLKPREAWPGNPTAQNFVVVQWQAEAPGFDLVAVNLAAHPGQCRVSLDVPNLADRTWLIEDLSNAEPHECPGAQLQAQGLFLDLPEHGARLIRFKSIG